MKSLKKGLGGLAVYLCACAAIACGGNEAQETIVTAGNQQAQTTQPVKVAPLPVTEPKVDVLKETSVDAASSVPPKTDAPTHTEESPDPNSGPTSGSLGGLAGGGGEVARPRTSYAFDQDYTKLIQSQGEKRELLAGPLEYITSFVNFYKGDTRVLAIFGANEGSGEEGIVDIYADKNMDGLHQKEERVSRLAVGLNAEVVSSTFLKNGEILYLDAMQNKIRRIIDTNKDGIPDQVSTTVYWSSERDEAVAGYDRISADELGRVTLTKRDSREVYTILDTNGDGRGDQGSKD